MRCGNIRSLHEYTHAEMGLGTNEIRTVAACGVGAGMRNNLKVHSIFMRVGDGRECLCMCEDEDVADKLRRLLADTNVAEEYEIIIEEIVANIDMNIKEWR